jgi:hypothetical protein
VGGGTREDPRPGRARDPRTARAGRRRLGLLRVVGTPAARPGRQRTAAARRAVAGRAHSSPRNSTSSTPWPGSTGPRPTVRRAPPPRGPHAPPAALHAAARPPAGLQRDAGLRRGPGRQRRGRPRARPRPRPSGTPRDGAPVAARRARRRHARRRRRWPSTRLSRARSPTSAGSTPPPRPGATARPAARPTRTRPSATRGGSVARDPPPSRVRPTPSRPPPARVGRGRARARARPGARVRRGSRRRGGVGRASHEVRRPHRVLDRRSTRGRQPRDRASPLCDLAPALRAKAGHGPAASASPAATATAVSSARTCRPRDDGARVAAEAGDESG